ncbi:phage portal protein [Glycomyces mayteni]|uniref:Phage portal protein n=1 Tax=Glycomyces mayteni TaxID=543887 RepID=A0ABW2D4M3_9ACTN|nr:phage portal protein [Glycomyces mayteni]
MATVTSDSQTDGYESEYLEFDLAEVDDDDLKAADQLIGMLGQEQTYVKECDDYFYGRHKTPYTPTESSSEYKALADRAITNMVPLIISNIAQLLYVEGYIPSKSKELGQNSKSFDEDWNRNRMQIRQRQLIRGALRYGVAYSVQYKDDEDKPAVRLVSPSKMMAGFADPANDERPAFALERIGTRKTTEKYILWRHDGTYRDLSRTEVKGRDGKTRWVWNKPGDPTESGLPHCAVIRHTYDLDIDGRYVGEIRPIVTLQDRLNQTVMDRLLVQTYGSFKIRYATGIAIDSEEDRIRMSKSRMLIGEIADAKFGSLPETPLDGFIKSVGVDQETISAISSIPPHYLTGELNNLGAEAIAEARAAMEAKAKEIKDALAEGIKMIMRDLAYLRGDMEDAEDYGASVVWHDAQNRSLSQVADALGKLATMLKVPVQELWSKIPGVTRGDVRRWTKALEKNQMAAMAFEAEEGMNEEIERDDPNAVESDDEAPTRSSGRVDQSSSGTRAPTT